jgi:hypothetical protein
LYELLAKPGLLCANIGDRYYAFEHAQTEIIDHTLCLFEDDDDRTERNTTNSGKITLFFTRNSIFLKITKIHPPKVYSLHLVHSHPVLRTDFGLRITEFSVIMDQKIRVNCTRRMMIRYMIKDKLHTVFYQIKDTLYDQLQSEIFVVSVEGVSQSQME